MSRWIHVTGCVEFAASHYDCGPDGPDGRPTSISLPFPKEQMSVRPIGVGRRPGGDSKIGLYGLDVEVSLSSFPRARPLIEEALKCLPKGEMGFIHTLVEKSESSSGASDLFFDCEREAFEDAVLSMLGSIGDSEPDGYNSLSKRYGGIQVAWVDHYTLSLLSFRIDLRHSCGEEFLEGWEKAMKSLRDVDIDPVEGYVEWIDDYEPGRRYVWRVEDRWDDVMQRFMLLDSKTGDMIWQKRLVRPTRPDGHTDYDADPIWMEDSPFPSAK